jgi:hypothetical protein
MFNKDQTKTGVSFMTSPKTSVRNNMNWYIAILTNTVLKDRLGDQRGGSEWEPIKILL